MPELPDVAVYIRALQSRVVGQRLESVELRSPFLLRSVNPPLSELHGRTTVGVRRLGKRIVFEFESGLFLVLHLMIAGRLHWRERGAKAPGRRGLAGFHFSSGTLVLTEAGRKRRASLYLVRGEEELARHDPGGLEVLECDREAFVAAVTRENHTLKRALTDPTTLSGIGNAYSDEILHRARLSPVRLTRRLSAEELSRLHSATLDVLREWIERLASETGAGFPEKVTAFRPQMAVHGRYREPCPTCGSPVQRIVRAENEANYCATCQTGGKLLADRALSRLLKRDWPRTLEALEELRSSDDERR
jgi:formamidopyrimidine-DNA glycosylase